MIMTHNAASADRYVAIDICDRCAARAQTLVVLANGGELLFCGHHARAYRYALTRAGAWLEDLSTPSSVDPVTV